MKNQVKRSRSKPAMIVAVVALVAALTGSAYAGEKLGLGALTSPAKDKMVGVGKLTYVTGTATPVAANPAVPVKVIATCPPGLRPIGGGVKLSVDDPLMHINATYPTASGWAGTVNNDSVSAGQKTATAFAICAISRSAIGSPPVS